MGTGLLCGESCMILTPTDPPVCRRDGRTDGRATAYSALCIYAVAR